MKVVEIIKSLREAARFEEEYADQLENIASKVKNPLLRMLLELVAYDSRRHSILYAMAAELAAAGFGPIPEREVEEMRNIVAHHAELERKMVETASRLAREVGETTLASILSTIVCDEEAHHLLFNRLVEALSENGDRTAELIGKVVSHGRLTSMCTNV